MSEIDHQDGFSVAIQITAKPGEGDAIAAILQGLIEPTMAEPGVKVFAAYRSPDDPLKFFVYELYEDRAAWDAHNEAPHFLAVVNDLVAKAAYRKRVPYLPL